MERRLSELMGEQEWRKSGLCGPADYKELQRQVSRPEQCWQGGSSWGTMLGMTI
ncbi:hypothetical protein ACWEWG_26390 [Streptomyces sp. NPDC003758]|uniref:Uncharacterized protein n=1 Tax=Streptomyces cynarae TaxID=2981134 RepID=A0ABY6EEB1_9ACTN|nr:hypothetical protein [Streptomyces cynarae]UXY24086.1 hypothetical protein N8I84_39320 [Streptomyces cynarae]